MKWMCETVHSKEDYTLRYMMTEQLNAETPTYIMIETYARMPSSHTSSREC